MKPWVLAASVTRGHVTLALGQIGNYSVLAVYLHQIHYSDCPCPYSDTRNSAKLIYSKSYL